MKRQIKQVDLESELNKGALWAVTYGDMMSYMMIFFLVMFSFAVGKGNQHAGGNDTTKQRAEKAEQAEKIDEALASIQTVFGGRPDPTIKARKEQRIREEDVAESLQATVNQHNLGNMVTVNTNEERVRLVLKEAVVFDSGQAELKPAAVPILTDIAAALAKVPNEIIVEGHTDNVPIHHGRYSSNWELSMARAYAVIKFFQEHGIDPKRLSGIGYGEFRPIADNSTPQGRAQNRRIGITLLRGSAPIDAPSDAPGAQKPAAPGEPAQAPAAPPSR